MRHLIFLFLIALCTLLGTSCKNSKSERTSQDNKIYQNEFFSLEYPFNWEYDEEINDMCDTIPAMSKGIRVTFFNNPNTPWHTVMVQKSAMFECFKTPKEWRDASQCCLLKEFCCLKYYCKSGFYDSKKSFIRLK